MLPNLYGLERPALAEILHTQGARSFDAGQVYRWLYRRREHDPAGWTDLPASLRQRLGAAVRVDPGRIEARALAADGTVKYRIGFGDGRAVEAVFMVQRDRVTLCLSSQVGCALDCDFCLTGKMGLVRHLHPGEIVGQVALIQADRELAQDRFNVVFMGMGEPLHNYQGLTAAIRLLTDPEGIGLSRRRITVSTSGMAPAIERLAKEPVRPRLAVSLNATTDAARERLMPINRRYPLERLLAACRTFVETSGERLTFEYVLLQGVNDTDDDVERLTSILRRHPARLNLIPFNAVPGRLAYQPPSRQRVVAIRDRLLARGLAVSIRWSRGAEARAACGQLALLPGEAGA
jgi:23S rRNA (adenine2503-C2)-methyltransferase